MALGHFGLEGLTIKAARSECQSSDLRVPGARLAANEFVEKKKTFTYAKSRYLKSSCSLRATSGALRTFIKITDL